MIVYASRTGNVEYIISKLDIESVKIKDELIISEPYLLFTYTDGLGQVPNEVSKFLVGNHSQCKGVISSGNSNFGVNNFCGSADKINAEYNIPIVSKIELRGFNSDYEYVKKHYNTNIKQEE